MVNYNFIELKKIGNILNGIIKFDTIFVNIVLRKGL